MLHTLVMSEVVEHIVRLTTLLGDDPRRALLNVLTMPIREHLEGVEVRQDLPAKLVIRPRLIEVGGIGFGNAVHCGFGLVLVNCGHVDPRRHEDQHMFGLVVEGCFDSKLDSIG